jgi:hypothetical protein
MSKLVADGAADTVGQPPRLVQTAWAVTHEADLSLSPGVEQSGTVNGAFGVGKGPIQERQGRIQHDA